MKKLVRVTPILMCILFLIYPILDIIAKIMDFLFEPYNIIISIALISVISLILTIWFFKNHKNNTTLNKCTKIFSVLSLPLSFISGMYFIENGEKNQFFYLIIIFVIITIISSVFLFKIDSPNLVLEVVITTISFLMSLILIFEILLLILFGNFSSSTVIKSLNSPENTYTAEVIDNDQGALGGATLVKIQYNNHKLNVLLGEFKKYPEIIYDGDWGEFKNMTLKWENENTLLINDIPYNVS